MYTYTNVEHPEFSPKSYPINKNSHIGSAPKNIFFLYTNTNLYIPLSISGIFMELLDDAHLLNMYALL